MKAGDVAPNPAPSPPEDPNMGRGLRYVVRVLDLLLAAAVIFVWIVFVDDSFFDRLIDQAILAVVALGSLTVLALAWWRDGLGGMVLVVGGTTLLMAVEDFDEVGIGLFVLGVLHLVVWLTRRSEGREAQNWLVSRRPFLLTAPALAAATLLLLGLLAWEDYRTDTIRGRIIFPNAAAGVAPGARCEGGIWFGLNNSTNVYVHDEQLHKLGSAPVGEGTADTSGACVFSFVIEHVERAETYKFSFPSSLFGHRERTLTVEELDQQDWRVEFIVD